MLAGNEERVMEIADLIAGEPASVSTWTHRVYERIRGQSLSDAAWRSLFELGVATAAASLAPARSAIAGNSAALSFMKEFTDVSPSFLK